MKSLSRLAFVCSVLLALSLLPGAHAAGKKKASPSPAASASPSPSAGATTKMVRVIPFHGMISAVDSKAKTFTLTSKKEASRVFKMTDQTAITKAGDAPATMKDVVEKEEVRGSYWKEADGTLMAKMVKMGPPTEQEKSEDAARKAKRAAKKAKAAAASPAASASPSASPKP